MKKIYLVGWKYDDFGEGGFSIMFASENKNTAIEVLKEFKKEVPYDDFGKVPYALRVLTLDEKSEEKILDDLDIDDEV